MISAISSSSKITKHPACEHQPCLFRGCFHVFEVFVFQSGCTSGRVETLRSYRGKLEEEFAVKRIGIFDSFAKGVAAEESDVNFLVEFDRDLPLIGFSLLWNSLKNLQEEEWTS